MIFIIGEIGIGKEFLVCVCYYVLNCFVKLFIVLLCVLLLDDVVEFELFGYVGYEENVVLKCGVLE